MKRKLKIVFVLIAISLTGIIILQAYWGFNAFKVNKQKFDADINVAMQHALDSCKKDYFDSIRVVMVRRLSEPGAFIKIDTIHEADTVHKQLQVYIGNKHTRMLQPFHTTSNVFDFYRQKINHKATVPEVITEMSFYVPRLMDEIMLILGFGDTIAHGEELRAFLKAHSNEPSDSVMAHNQIIKHGVLEMPPNFRQADSIKLHRYYTAELHKLHPHARQFELRFSDKPTPPQPADPHHVNELHYSETDEQPYFFHGFTFVNHNIFNHLYVRAVFRNPQVGVLTEMTAVLISSGLLILFTIFCFYYIIRTIVHQKKLTELKDDFINNMTHELKTPIATITVAIEGLQKYDALHDPEKTKRYLQTSRNELNRLNDLVSKVLHVAAFDQKDISLMKEPVDVDELMRDLIAAEEVKADKKLNITYNNKSHITQVEVDKLHFRNVLGNILDNAVKYTSEPVVITIDVVRNKNIAVFTIADNGIGIPPAHINHIFDKFHRVPAGNVHNVKGTGLGLSYVKYIVEAHGGTVSVKSELNKGTEFTIILPVKNG